MDRKIRIAVIVLLALAIVVSFTLGGRRLTDPETYSHSIEVLDRNRSTVLSLSAASAAASAAVSALPQDICSPMAEELSDFSTWFLIILTVLYLEKYLLTIFGSAACYFLIPLGCTALMIHCFFPGETLKRIGGRLIALSAVILLVIPTSVWVSDQVNEVYAKSIEITVESANAVSDNLIGEGEKGKADGTIIDKAASLIDNVSGSVSDIVAQFKNILNRFIEATAVMIVTTCLIPILVLLFFAWIAKTLFGAQILVPARLTQPLLRRQQPKDGNPD